MDSIKISKIKEEHIPATQDFLLVQLQALFNKDGQIALTRDVWGLKENYILAKRNEMWIAYDEVNESVIGTIAISQYNDRIESIKGRYLLENTAEIGRCYVAPHLRRQGVGAQLLQVAEFFCQEHGYHTLYLHTHHFLPGGYHFWLKNNFKVVLDEGGKDEIIHMEKLL